MAKSRGDFLSKGYYDNLSKKLQEILTPDLLTSLTGTSVNILDAGCGEGYFTWRLGSYLNNQHTLKSMTFWGIDISKPAIKYAARRAKMINFAVASLYRLPVLSECLDCIIQIIAPGSDAEYRRVLKPSGKLIAVTPGPNHLSGLKELIYQTPGQHSQRSSILDGFDLIECSYLSYEIYLKTNEDIVNLFNMTLSVRSFDSQIRKMW